MSSQSSTFTIFFFLVEARLPRCVCLPFFNNNEISTKKKRESEKWGGSFGALIFKFQTLWGNEFSQSPFRSRAKLCKEGKKRGRDINRFKKSKVAPERKNKHFMRPREIRHAIYISTTTQRKKQKFFFFLILAQEKRVRQSSGNSVTESNSIYGWVVSSSFSSFPSSIASCVFDKWSREKARANWLKKTVIQCADESKIWETCVRHIGDCVSQKQRRRRQCHSGSADLRLMREKDVGPSNNTVGELISCCQPLCHPPAR